VNNLINEKMFLPLKMNHWYIVRGFFGHMGIKKYRPVVIFFYSSDITEVLSRYIGMPRVKRSLSASKTPDYHQALKAGERGYFPDMKELTDQEALDLEQRIKRENKISLEEAKKKWYYGRLPDWQIYSHSNK
jgi:hypothetical protein